MQYYKDHKDRLHSLIGIDADHTHLRCCETGATIMIANAIFNVVFR